MAGSLTDKQEKKFHFSNVRDGTPYKRKCMQRLGKRMTQ